MYYRHFRLSGPPFEAAVGAEALYLSRAHRESLAALEWGLLHEPSGFTTLTGETGTGKTTLVCSILSRSFAQLRPAYVVNPKLSFPDLLRVILEQLGIQCTGTTKLDRIETLVAFLGRRAANERLAIIVDEAQDLSDDALEELRLLSNYGQRVGRYLQLVLVGQPELAVRLKRPSLRQFAQRVAARSVLGRLSFAEAHEYVEYRLRAKGGRAQDIFDSDALDYLLRHSGGIPRQINVLCHNAMLTAYASGGARIRLNRAKAAVAEFGDSLLSAYPLTIPPQWAQPAIAGIAALALLLAVGYSYRGAYGQAPYTSKGALLAAARHSAPSLDTSATKVLTGAPLFAAARASRTSLDDRSPGTSRDLPTTSTFSSGSAQRPDAPAAVLHALLSAELTSDREQGSGGRAVRSRPPAAQKSNQQPSIVVRYGDTLEKIALEYLGSRYALNGLIHANPQITDINRIYPGQRIYLSAAGGGSSTMLPARVASRHSAAESDDTHDSNGSEAANAPDEDASGSDEATRAPDSDIGIPDHAAHAAGPDDR